MKGKLQLTLIFSDSDCILTQSKVYSKSFSILFTLINLIESLLNAVQRRPKPVLN